MTTPAADIVVITGPPGAGKTTVAKMLGERLEPLTCVVESDFWWTTVVNGFIPPWLPAAHEQNRTIIRSFSRAVAALADGGYTVVLDGIIGPWNLDLVVAEADAVHAVARYVVLRPSPAIPRRSMRNPSARCGTRSVSSVHTRRTSSTPVTLTHVAPRKLSSRCSVLGD